MSKVLLPISDLHSEANIYEIIKNFMGQHIDFITISGDILEKYSDYNLMIFKELLDLFPMAKIVFISGNHDYHNYSPMITAQGLEDKVFYLENEIKVIDGVKFYGCPFSTPFMNWNHMRDEDQIADVLEATMDHDIDVALFHQPAYGFGDVVGQRFVTGENLGSHAILNAINKWQPRYCFVGHIHSGDHTTIQMNGATLYKNVSVLNEYYARDIDHLETFEI